MSLSDIVLQVIDETKDADGSIPTQKAVTLGLPLVKRDGEAVDQCIKEALSIRIKNVATRERNKEKGSAPSDMEDLFGLRPRHALDIEGRVLKATHALTRLDFERIRQIRRESLLADAAYLKKLDDAAAALSGIWDDHPALTYGEACALLRRAA
jgi:hypothetical protein